MQLQKIKSYAKINLSLNVIGLKKNKLHKIESIVSFLDLHDMIYLKDIKSKKHKITFVGKFSKGIPKKNTVSKLLLLLDSKNYLKGKKFEIKIIKNIPQRSGMGGGSMNAANLISFFIKKNIIKLNKKELINLTSKIGSDVILGIIRKNTILSCNDKITRFKKKIGLYALIVKPKIGCSTHFIYSKVRGYSKPLYQKPNKILLNKEMLVNSNNDLEKLALKAYPKLNQLKIFMNNLHNYLFIRMTGSGSSIIVYFQSKKATVVALKLIKKKFKDYWFFVSKTL